ncbi:MAG TPA: DEAD/DEAH box helicase [Bdellovibrionales bacterium]|nr:MAG: DEAD/DEAH box helicase [Bdellovibrionales bacterium GWB1_52_6]OFZ03803.1 MAG: DEAD/DEAH box helicase [Bdellovibrionales bacterium GWA1_52_35]OFZ37108.1 MAG: DEAD/DEAH box helicase [Bdellovibrionales bacterium GWC1_52_8]HAR41053.1 DEAD/DEAH box helicase [Bdellovibrionales bacterium]HCM40215.1 DEAD/DEAH box helicase [Bdellovibrionales bacterium]
MKLITLSIREFALPVPRTGSIDAQSGYGKAQEGQEIHLRVQASRLKDDPSYEAEVPLSQSFEREGYCFKVGGRMDGFFPGEPPRIEEIKSTFNIWDLSRRLTEFPLGHPYDLQLQTYGYFYWLEHQVVPRLFFHLVSTRGRETHDLERELNIQGYAVWLENRLDELVIEAQKAEKRASRRRKIAVDFTFPFDNPRRGQLELIASIEEGMKEGKRMLVQAPTGLGKTAGVLYPVLKEALSRGQRVVYITPKNSQHLVAEDAVERFQDTGSKIKSLSITAKSKICFKNEPLCNPDYCEFARDYYRKVHEHGLLDLLARKKKLKASVFKKIGEEFEVCPFELQLDGAQEADTVICDYNYVFAPRTSFGRMTLSGVDQEGQPNLVIDEAHNLPSRAMDYYSPALSSLALEKMRDEVRALPSLFRGEAERQLDQCIQAIITCRPEPSEKPARIDPPLDPFLEEDGNLRSLLSRYLDSSLEIQPRDVILRLSFYWSAFTEALQYVKDPQRTEFFTTFHSHPTGGVIKITCCDASELIQHAYDDYDQVVGFSATLKPFDYYSRLSGLDPDDIKQSEFQSPFDRGNRKLLIIPQISTKYSDRERSYPKVAEVIQRVTALRAGNYLAFFPSFEFLERVIAQFVPPPGFTVLKQQRDMRAAEVEGILEHLRSEASPTIVFAVQGGTFSEGVDYPGGMAIGAFVVGPPLPNFDLEREQMRAYYQENYGAGFDYAYAIPAMSKAIQAAGRVIRSETDRGLIVLIDSRFVQAGYSRAMPVDWFKENPQELVSAGILKEVAEFWEKPLLS